MESLTALDPTLAEILPALLILPLVPYLASTLVLPLGCPLDFTVMVVYMIYGIYYSINVEGALGVLRFGAGFIGMVTATVLCLPEPST